jgi:hypothetical protein
MFRIIFLLSLVINSVLISAQRLRPFQIIEFSGLNPDWIVPVKDTVLSENTTIHFIDEYNSITPSTYLPDILIHEDLLFQSMHIGGGLELGGSLIDCRDLNTGKLIWQKRYGIYGDSIQAAIRIMKINSEGNLVVMGQRKKYPLGSPLNTPNFIDMVLFEDIYNVKSGELIRGSECDYDNETIVPTLFSPWEGTTSPGAFLIEGDNYRNIEYRRYGQDRFLRSFVLNKCGELLTDTLSVQVYDNIDNVNLIEIGPDTIMVLSKKYLPNDSLFAFNLKYYTRDLLLLDSVLTDPFPNFMLGQKILGLSSDRKKILIRWERWDNDNPIPPTPQSIGVFDLKGKLLKVADLPASRFLNPLALEWENDSDNLTIIQTDFRQQNPKTAETYLKSIVFNGKTGESIDVSLYKVADSLQIGIFGEIYRLPENKLLILGGQNELYIKQSGTISQDADGFATILMLVDKDRFTKPTSSREVAADVEGLIIYPNPGWDALTLAWQYPFSGEITVHNAQGLFVRQYPVDHQQEYIIDASAWPPGLYLMRIYDSQKQVTNIKKWVKR